MENLDEPDLSDDDRPPICPACGVTMGIVVGDDTTPRHVCLECGFTDDAARDGSSGSD